MNVELLLLKVYVLPIEGQHFSNAKSFFEHNDDGRISNPLPRVKLSVQAIQFVLCIGFAWTRGLFYFLRRRKPNIYTRIAWNDAKRGSLFQRSRHYSCQLFDGG